jgi:hypothetical protein
VDCRLDLWVGSDEESGATATGAEGGFKFSIAHKLAAGISAFLVAQVVPSPMVSESGALKTSPIAFGVSALGRRGNTPT